MDIIIYSFEKIRISFAYAFNFSQVCFEVCKRKIRMHQFIVFQHQLVKLDEKIKMPL